MNRSAGVGGIAGPATFIATWAVLGSITPGYSAVRDPVSRLAAAGAPTRWRMTAGLIGLGAGLGLFSRGLAADHQAAARAARLAAASTFGIAATPLDSVVGGRTHAATAGVAYASLAAIPALVARDRARDTGYRTALTPAAAATISATALALSTTGERHAGAWQRLGLTVAHLWVALTSWSWMRAEAAAQSAQAHGGRSRLVLNDKPG